MAIVNHGIETGNAGAGNSGQGFLLSLGAEGAEVKKWQEYLMSQGYGVSASGVFDKSTQIATRNWQTRNGLARTGSVNADAYALAGLKVGVEADIDTSAGITEATNNITESTNNADTTSPAETKEPEKTEAAAPTTPTTPTTPSSETEKKEEPQVPPQLRDPNPQLTETNPTYGNDYVNGDSKAEDPKQDLPPQLVDPNPNLGEKQETAEDPKQNLPPQVVDPNPELSGNATYGGDYVNADAPKTEDPAAKLPPQVVDPNPSLDKNQTTAPEDPRQNIPPQAVDPNPNLPKGDVQTPNNTPTTQTNGAVAGAMAGAMAGAGTSSVPENNTPSNPPSEPTTDALSDAPSYGKDYVNGDAEPTTPTTPTEPTTPAAPTDTPSDQNEVDPNQYVGNTTDGGNGDPNAPDNNPTRVEEVKAPPMNYEEFLKSETETSGTSEVTKANDKETADVLAGLDQKANEGNNTPVKESFSGATTEAPTDTTTGTTTEASTGTTSPPANDGQEETPSVYGNTDEDYVPGTTMTWAEYFAQQENANSANSNGNTNESGMTNEDTSTEKTTENSKTESKEETSNADVFAGLAKIRDDGYKLAEDTKKNAEAAAIGAYERAITEAETAREKSVIDARNAAAQRRADYGANAEALANMGLKSSGYSAYLDQQSYETERAETQAANALADYNKRMAGYAKEDADRIAAENYAKSIYDIDTTYQTNLLAADDRASAKDRQTASDFRTILADVGTGAYTKEQALQLARDLGLSEEQIRAIEGAADEYTASVEEAERAEQEAEDKEHQDLVDGYKAMVTPDTTDEDIESLKEVGLTQEDVDALKAARDAKIVADIESYIESGDFESFADAIESAYGAKTIDHGTYQSYYASALEHLINDVKTDEDLSAFVNNVSTLEKDHKISEAGAKRVLESVLEKVAIVSDKTKASYYDGHDRYLVENPNNGNYFFSKYGELKDNNIVKLLNIATQYKAKEGDLVAMNGRVYGFVPSGKNGKAEWVELKHSAEELKTIINIMKGKNENIPHNSTTVLDREGNNDNKF